jgi:hypothetical protein
MREDKDDAAAIYRRLHPRAFQFSPWERQMELRDLWPSDQREFREMIRKIREQR